MKAKFVSELLEDCGLENPEFSILKPDAELTHILFLQPRGTIVVKSDHAHIGNEPSPDTNLKYRDFFRLADARNSELAITPEYSCPLEIIKEIILGDVFPKLGKLWVVGSESIDKSHLSDLKQLLLKNEVFLHFDHQVLDGGNEIVDPVFYLFGAKSSQGEFKRVVFIQFKSTPMGVWSDSRERSMIITGTEIYIVRNSEASISLVTLNCSDALNYKNIFEAIEEADNQWAIRPYLILHPQLNPKPSDPNFFEYRRTLFSHRKNCELLCVNWARSTGEKNNDTISPWIGFSGSMLTMVTNEMNFDEDVFHYNFSRGCYLINCEKGRFSYYFHSDEWVFGIKTTKVSQVGGGAMLPQMRRSGIDDLTPYIWNGTEWIHLENNKVPPDHLFFEEWSSMKSLLEAALPPLEVEKLIELSTGRMNLKLHPNQWWAIDKISSLKQTDSENILSITFSQDKSEIAKKERRERADNFHEIQNRLIHNPHAFPDNFRKFATNHEGKLRFNLSHLSMPPTNLSLLDRTESITVVYLGSTGKEDAAKFEKQFESKFEGQNGKRLLVWFKHGGELHYRYDGRPVLITDAIPKEPTAEIESITRQ